MPNPSRLDHVTPQHCNSTKAKSFPIGPRHSKTLRFDEGQILPDWTTPLQNITIRQRSNPSRLDHPTPKHCDSTKVEYFPIRVAKPHVTKAQPTHSKTSEVCLFRLFIFWEKRRSTRQEAHTESRGGLIARCTRRRSRQGGAHEWRNTRSKSPLADAAKNVVNVATHPSAVEPPLMKAAKGRGEA